MSDSARAWGWLAHLRAGGTTRWRSWTDESDEGPGPGRRVPGAQRLEVLRRLNEGGDVPPLLVETVLTTTSLGRGQQERRLLDGGPVEPFGAPRVTPSEIPVSELRRIATGALADLARQASAPSKGPAVHPLPWRRTRLRLVGDPLLVAAYAGQLAARGRPLGGRRPQVAVLLAPLDQALSDVWARRVLRGGRVRWLAWVEGVASRGLLPEAADAAAVAARWAARVGRDRVHLCGSAAGLAELSGLRPSMQGGATLTDPRRLSPPAVETVRGVSRLLHLAVPEDRLPDLLEHVVVPWVAAADPGPPTTGWLPPAVRPWVAEQATRVRDSLVVAGYPVHGGGGEVVAQATSGADRLTDQAVLAVLLAALPRAARAVADSGDADPQGGRG